MAISDKLLYLNGTKQAIKDELNRFGSNITENDTFRSYSNVINDIYDKLPKVSGNGSNFTLENAQNGKLDLFEMDGNTEQTTYTGKNLLAYTSYGEAKQGITTTYDSEDGALILNGKANNTFSNLTNESSIDIATGTYTFSIKEAKNYNIRLAITCTDSTTINSTINKGSTSTTVNINKATLNQRIFIYENDTLSGTTFTNEKIYAQLESGSTATSFEPYVGGTPSPNPDYPQEVKVVENEQIVNVTGKNKMGFADGTYTNNQGITATVEGGKVILNGTGTANPSGVTIPLSKSVVIPTNTQYTLSAFNNSINSNVLLRLQAVGSSNPYSNATLSSVNATATIQSSEEYEIDRLFIRVDQNTTLNNFIIYPQLEQGSTATTYEPCHNQNYEIDLGNIELCKIGDYKDSIKKSIGKNLFDKDSVILGKVWNGASNTKRAYGYIKAIQGQVYTASTQDTSSDLNIYITETAVVGTGGEHIKQTELTSTLTFTPQSATEYIVVQFSTTTNDITQEMVNNALIQIEEGSTATSYEPYGTDWYIKKEIGKVVLDGSEDWSFGSSGGYPRATINSLNDIMTYADTNRHIGRFICSHFTPDITNGTGHMYQYQNTILCNPTSDITSLNAFKTWLNTNKPSLYYVLATPTYEKITNSTLISQLESIEAFTGLNIFSVSNENNVLPTLYVSRLKELGKLE